MSPKLTDKHLTFVGIDKVLNVEFLLHFATKKKDKETFQCFQLCEDTFTKQATTSCAFEIALWNFLPFKKFQKILVLFALATLIILKEMAAYGR